MTLALDSPGNCDPPVISLAIDGQNFMFLLDSGATMSSVGRGYEGPFSYETVRSVGIDGVPFDTPLTPLLPIYLSDSPNVTLSHRFVSMAMCPYNLLGRDLMSMLHITLVFKNDRLVIHTPDSVDPPLGALNGAFVCSIVPIASRGLPTILDTVPPQLWAQQKDEVGLVACVPYEATLKHLQPVYIKQYPLSEDKMQGIDVILASLQKQHVVRQCSSPYNTPVNPVRKPDGTWRFTQDLRRINELIIPVAPLVPDVTAILMSIDCTHDAFSVVDLCSAFFSIPVETDTQPLFAFTHRGKQ